MLANTTTNGTVKTNVTTNTTIVKTNVTLNTTAALFVPTDYYNYRWWMFLAICINVSVTYLFEKLTIPKVEHVHQKWLKDKKTKAFQDKIKQSELQYNN